jgi:hypothetical protein
MWGASPMTAPDDHCDIRPYEKSAHLLVCSPAKKVFWTEFSQTSPSRLSFKMRYDWMYSSHVYSEVSIDSISVCLKLEIGSGVLPDWRVMDFRQTLENMRSSWHS